MPEWAGRLVLGGKAGSSRTKVAPWTAQAKTGLGPAPQWGNKRSALQRGALVGRVSVLLVAAFLSRQF
jgi:hypothetical protein